MILQSGYDMRKKLGILIILAVVSCLSSYLSPISETTNHSLYAQVLVLPIWLAALLAFHIGLLLTIGSLFYIIRKKSFKVYTGYGSFGPGMTCTVSIVAMMIGFLLLYYFEMFDTLQGIIALCETFVCISALSFRSRKSDSQ
jgi:hypothetical protein